MGYQGIAEGRMLLAAEAKPILDYFNILPSTVISIGGMEVQHQGTDYIIFQRDYYIPWSLYAPDGWHTVYEPSAEEIATYINPPETPDYLSSALKLGFFAVAVYAGAALLRYLK